MSEAPHDPSGSSVIEKPASKKALWTGRILTALVGLLMIFSAVMKFLKPAAVVQGMVHLGYPESLLPTLGILEAVCAILYLIPRTSVLGAILLTGYLGGATASTLRVGDPFLFPVIAGVLVWGGLFLRDPRLRKLIPINIR